MFNYCFKLQIALWSGLLLALPLPARAQFGGTTIVFDPSMYARQFAQLEQETAAVSNLAQQLEYMIKNTTGGGAGIWASNQDLLTNLGGLISEQQGAFLYRQQSRPAVPAALSRVCGRHTRRDQSAGQRRHHPQYAQRRAPERAGAGAKLRRRGDRPGNP
jgi:hypothetical protein